MKIEIIYNQDSGICWVCELKVARPGTIGRRSGLGCSRDHVLLLSGKTQIRLAHAVCNSKRGYKATVVTKELRQRMQKIVLLTQNYYNDLRLITIRSREELTNEKYAQANSASN